MDQNSANTIIEMLNQLLSKPDGSIAAAQITVWGMIGVTLITCLVQWAVTRTIIRSEGERLRVQLETDFRLRQQSAWEDEFRTTIATLLEYTDPEAYPIPEKQRVVPLILKSQLLLNLQLRSHIRINELINALGMAVNNWDNRSKNEILGMHERLLEAARSVTYSPN